MVDAVQSNVMKHLAFRSALNAGMFVGYSTVVLGNPISNSVLYNALAASSSAIASETIIKYLVPEIIPAKSQGLQGIGWSLAEAAGTGAIYSMVFPRVFPGLAGAIDMRQLAMTGFAIDFASQTFGPKVAALLEGGQTY